MIIIWWQLRGYISIESSCDITSLHIHSNILYPWFHYIDPYHGLTGVLLEPGSPHLIYYDWVILNEANSAHNLLRSIERHGFESLMYLIYKGLNSWLLYIIHQTLSCTWVGWCHYSVWDLASSFNFLLQCFSFFCFPHLEWQLQTNICSSLKSCLRPFENPCKHCEDYIMDNCIT